MGKGSTSELPGPKLLETPWGVQARQYLSDILGTQPEVPLQAVAGMTDLEKQGQSQLGNLLSGGTFEDPRDSDLYAGLRQEAQLLQGEGLSALRRRAGLSGMFNSSGAVGQEGNFLARSNASLLSQLGGLYNQERNRDNPYTRLAALQQYGSLPRDVQNQQNTAAYNQQLGQFNVPYQQAGIAQQLLNYQPWYQPQYVQEDSKLAGIAGGAGQGALTGMLIGGPPGAAIGAGLGGAAGAGLYDWM